MATYTLIQDIEAEDHILGPLTLRQFIFAMIAVFFFYLCFISVAKHVVFLLLLFLPPALFFGFFAVPFGRDQPTEIWALAKIRFWLKPRRRLWDQSGTKELVTINVPKKIERVYTDGLNPYEVKSRLKALATTLDSRGWVVKDMPAGVSGQIYSSRIVTSDSDRLIDVSSFQQQVPDDVTPVDADILDETSSPVAQNLDHMINESSQAHRKELIQQMNNLVAAQQANTPSSDSGGWFISNSSSNGSASVVGRTAAVQTETAEEISLANKIKAQHQAQQVPYSNLRTIQPLNSSSAPQKSNNSNGSQASVQAIANPMTTPSDPAILSLANNDDFTVATIAREAKKTKGDKSDDNEVVISLH